MSDKLRKAGDGYEVRTWVKHEPSGVVVLPGHPQLGGRYCQTDGGDWPCATVRAALAARPDSPTLDVALDRALAVPHRDDDQPCSCDECMAYGAEDSGADWYRIPPANRVAIRILDGADDRLAAIAKAFRDHDEDVSPTLDVERRLREMRYNPTLSGRSGDFRSGWDAATVVLLDALAAEAPERPA